ncbi:MAG: response regulator transcription factor [Betaproteobacteria bacterium]|nr:response regulator transcription factor [Betaproteobacteria bacterium]
MIRIIIVDDHAIVRRGIRDILIETPGITICGEAQDYTELRQCLRNTEADLVLLDINLPGKNGIEILKILHDQYPKLRVLVLSTHPEDQYALRALKAGAYGYLNKNGAPEQLIDAIQQIMSGRKYITASTAQSLVSALTGGDEEMPHEKLSDREFQTLRLMASGKRLSEIAEELALSPKTVSVYRARILEKMDLTTNAELTHYAIKNGLVE